MQSRELKYLVNLIYDASDRLVCSLCDGIAAEGTWQVFPFDQEEEVLPPCGIHALPLNPITP